MFSFFVQRGLEHRFHHQAHKPIRHIVDEVVNILASGLVTRIRVHGVVDEPHSE